MYIIKLVRLVSFLMMLALYSCGRHQNNKSNSVFIDLEVSLDKEKLEKYITDTRFISLETDSMCMIGEIGKCLVNEEYIYILDRKQSRVYQFSIDGKYIKTFSHQGRGAGEYIELTDIVFDNKRGLGLLDGIGKKILFVDTALNYLREMKVQKGDGLLILPDSRCVVYNDSPHPKEKAFAVYNTTGQLLFNCLPGSKSNRDKITFLRDNHLCLWKDSVALVRSFDYHVYYMANDSLVSSFSFDFGKYNMPTDLLQGNYVTAYQRVLKDQSVQMLDRFIETDKWITFKAGNKVVWWDKVGRDYFITSNGWEIPYSLIFSDAPLCYAGNGKYYMSITAINLKNGICPLLKHPQYLEKYPFLKQLENMDVKIDQNDFLVEVTM